MPKQNDRKRAAETYESDDGFVEDAASRPSSKKAKTAHQTGMQKDDDGNEFWEISKSRRVQISEFSKKTLIGIREFYEKDGKMLPGKKGIALTVEQFADFLKVLPEVREALAGRGIELPGGGDGGGGGKVKKTVVDTDDDVQDAEDEEREKTKSKLDRFKMKPKQNHEETSEEE